MLDSAGSFPDIDVSLVSGYVRTNLPNTVSLMSRQLCRGQIVTGAKPGRFLVWSHGPDDAVCLPLSRDGGVLFGHALVRFARGSLAVVGVSSGDTLALARQAVAALAERVAPALAAKRDVAEEIDTIRGNERNADTRGSLFWNGAELNEGCFWVRGVF